MATAAASEIEEYTRIEADLPAVGIAGNAVGNLVHLLAELLENATAYSPPHTNVKVDGRRTVDGLVIRVHDQGIGISDTRLAEINKRLSAPATLSSAAAGSMGLHVVSHLAARHQIRVSLHATGSGTMANVELPESILTLPQYTFRQGPPSIERSRPTPAVTSAPAMTSAPTLASAPATTSAPTVASASATTSAPTAWFQVGHTAPASRQSAAADFSAQRAPTMTLPVVGSLGQPAGPDRLPSSGGAGQPPWPPTGPGRELPTQPGRESSGGSGRELPRRAKGQWLMAELQAPPTAPQPASAGQAAEFLDPEQVRARLSALAEGVATAMRRSQPSDPTRRQQ
ncbi:Histidine kinase-, DNA gyrase B-, and HSP90-like ATPase [Micromonospora pallida]|uniref:histidine kinase n=1 Tax=Micromonospora pallida TaxID=145854 RepID=A0A1C6RPI3_9ACTN|nr:ATP-binding protein [Micromonospora pallida]SCL19028.1 Histidine kinase-, DNA gyrase B-, and HSP90-like ATPase [Micromonospora pallida]